MIFSFDGIVFNFQRLKMFHDDIEFHAFISRISNGLWTNQVLKIRTIFYVWDLWKLARSCKQLYLLCLPDPLNLPGTALLSGFQSS